MNRAQRIARELAAHYGVHDPLRLAECMGVLVVTCDLPETVEGFYHRFEGRQIIYLSDRLTACRRRVVCGHELGHAAMHEEINSLLIDAGSARLENEADLFCAELLLGGGECEGTDVETLVRETGLPERAVRMRYHQL